MCETNYFSAILLYKELIKKFSDHEKADNSLYRLGKLYFLHNNYTEAIRTFEKLIDNYRKSNYIYGSYYYLGLIHLVKNDINHAIEFFDTVIKQRKKHKFHIESLVGKANCYFEKKKYDKCVYYFKEALKIKNKNYYPTIYLGLGNSYYKQKNYDKAYYYLRKVAKECPGSPEYELAMEKIEFIKNNKTIFDQIDWSKFKAEERPDEKKPKKKYYTIQIASVKNKRFANDWRIRLKSTGFPAFSKTAKTDKGTFYRTCVGKYETMEQAKKDKKNIEHKFKLDCIIVELK